MKSSPNHPEAKPASRASVIASFVSISAFLGFLIGLFQAYLLWTRPRVIPLLVPDVGWVIWFLAPLVDMLFFGLVGLVMGWLACWFHRREVFAAITAAVAVTFVVMIVLWFHVYIGLRPFVPRAEILQPLAVLCLALAAFLFAIEKMADSFIGKCKRRLAGLLRPLAWGLAVVMAAGLVGIGVFVEHPTLSATTAQAAPPPTGDPNIVFVVMDTVRADHLSAYGYSRPTTPNLDRFAKTGVLFENAIAASSWTLASHASMFTGLLPQQHGADWTVPLASGPLTLAEIFRSHGYQTGGFVANQLYMQRGWGIAQGMEHYQDDSDLLRHNLAETLLGSALIQPIYQNLWQFNYFDRESAGQLNKRVFHWFRHRSHRPYFLFINYFDVHEPYMAPREYSHRYGNLSASSALKLYEFGRSRRRAVYFSPGMRNSLIAGYDNCLAYLDDQLGKLLSLLRQSPQWKNTIVIITSDHGEEFGGHGVYEHGRNLYRGVLHVPLIIAGPGVPRGLRVNHIVATRELFSTILDLASRGKTPFSRTSLARFWEPGYAPNPSDNAVVSEVVPEGDLSGRHPMMSLTTPEWEYIVHRSGRQELYNWTNDPQEKGNLAAAPQDQVVLKHLRSRLIDEVGDATGPWRGMPYLGALANVPGASRVSLLRAHPDTAGNVPRIGSAQVFFRSTESTPIQPSKSERELLKSLPYQ